MACLRAANNAAMLSRTAFVSEIVKWTIIGTECGKMASKSIAEMMTVATAIQQGYGELNTIRPELWEWWSRMGPKRRPDNTSRSFFVYEIIKELDRLTPPDLSAVTDEALRREVCVSLQLDSKSREARKDNALAKLRPSVVALRKAGFSNLSDKISDDITIVAGMYYIRGAYQ